MSAAEVDADLEGLEERKRSTRDIETAAWRAHRRQISNKVYRQLILDEGP